MEDMIGRVMEKKLREAKVEDFEGKVNGLKALLENVNSMLKEIRKDNTSFPEDSPEIENLRTLHVQVTVPLF